MSNQLPTIQGGDLAEFETSAEPWSDDYAGDLLAAGAAHELRSVVAISMHPDARYSPSELSDMITKAQGGDQMETMGWPVQGSHDPISHARRGLMKYSFADVYRDGIGDEWAKKTETTSEDLDTIAGWGLVLAQKIPGSLIDLFGKMKRDREDEKRAPETRLALLQYILDNPDCTFSEAAGAVGTGTIESHIRGLERAGVLETKRDTEIGVRFVLDFDEEVMSELRFSEGSVVEAVREAMAGLGNGVTFSQLAELLKDHELFSGKSDEDREHSVNLAVKKIRPKTPVGTKRASRNDFSTARIREDAEDAIVETLLLFEAIKEGDAVVRDQLRRRGREIVSSASQVREILHVAYKRSPQTEKLTTEEKDNLILGLIAEGVNFGLDIRNVLEQRGHQFSQDLINLRLRNLRKAGVITATQSKGKRRANIYAIAVSANGVAETGVDEV